MFFNKIPMILLVLLAQFAFAQTSEHGQTFKPSTAMNKDAQLFQNLSVQDTVQVQLQGTIAEVCQAKGCWMNVNLQDNAQVFVRFKDYGFFVPTNSSGKSVVMNGIAFIEEMSVDEQRHYAEDNGATKDEIAKITTPKRTLRFEADGVQISN